MLYSVLGCVVGKMKIVETLTCPTCGRGWPGSSWRKSNPKPWRLGVKQCPNLRMQVLGELRSPGELVDPGVFEVMKSRLVDAVGTWVFHEWLDVRDVLARVAALGRWGGRWVWHQHVDIPPVVMKVGHGYGWGGSPEGGLPVVVHGSERG